MTVTHDNIEAIEKVAIALDEMNDEVIYVGGAVVSLYTNNPAAEEVRPTKDVDISLSVASLGELEQVRQKICEKGFTQTSEDTVLCRFRLGDIKVDVMNTKEVGWAPANPWFAPGLAMKQPYQLDKVKIWLLPVAFFLATKLTAFNNRGRNNPVTSHDFEDIVYVFNNTTDIYDQLVAAPADVKDYLRSAFSGILNSSDAQEAIEAHLPYDNRAARLGRIINILKEVVDPPWPG